MVWEKSTYFLKEPRMELSMEKKTIVMYRKLLYYTEIYGTLIYYGKNQYGKLCENFGNIVKYSLLEFSHLSAVTIVKL